MRLMSLADLMVTNRTLALVGWGEDCTRLFFPASHDTLVATGLRPRLEGYK